VLGAWDQAFHRDRRIIDHCGASTNLTSSSPLRVHDPSAAPRSRETSSPWANLDPSARLLPARHPPSVLWSLLPLDARSYIRTFQFCPLLIPRNCSPGTVAGGLTSCNPSEPLAEPRSVSVRHRTSRRRDGVVRGKKGTHIHSRPGLFVSVRHEKYEPRPSYCRSKS